MIKKRRDKNKKGNKQEQFIKGRLQNSFCDQMVILSCMMVNHYKMLESNGGKPYSI